MFTQVEWEATENTSGDYIIQSNDELIAKIWNKKMRRFTPI